MILKAKEGAMVGNWRAVFGSCATTRKLTCTPGINGVRENFLNVTRKLRDALDKSDDRGIFFGVCVSRQHCCAVRNRNPTA